MRKIWRLSYLIPGFWLYRTFGWPRLLPINYTFSLTTQCNSRCKTCKIWENPLKDELSVEEWERVIQSIGSAPIWITLSGGEVFLIEKLDRIILCIAQYNKPALLVIPTNALLVDRIISILKKVFSMEQIRTQIGAITVNVSLDGIGKLHDEIRGIPGNFDKAVKLIRELKTLREDLRANLVIGIHTVLSRWNIRSVKEISDFVWKELKPDHHIFEIAEVRKEMKNSSDSPTPSLEEYQRFLQFWLNDEIVRESRSRLKGVSRITDVFRKRYYRYLESAIYQREDRPLPSYAEFASVHINADGDVWNCAVFCDKMGNVKDYEFDFKRLWLNCPDVRTVQKRVKNSHRCPLANENYINLLMRPWELLG